MMYMFSYAIAINRLKKPPVSWFINRNPALRDLAGAKHV